MKEKSTILSDQFLRCKPGRPGWVNLTLTETSLIIHKEENCTWTRTNQQPTSFPFDQIIGCQILAKRTNKNENSKCRLSILVQSLSTSSSEPELSDFKQIRFIFETSSASESVAVQWRNEIMRKIGESQQAHFSSVHSMDRSKKLIIFVNPKSGDGRAVKMFEKSVQPALEHAGISYELILTQRPNHGRDFASSSDLSRWSGLVIVSGDGLLHEIIQGLFQRDDNQDVINIPLGIIPAGSGNGLARSLAHINKEKYDKGQAFASVLNLVSGRTKPMDLTRVRTQSGRTYYSFLSIGWGFLADCDIESEVLRFMGEPRFALWSAIRVANLRHYRGRLHYKPAVTSSDGPRPNSEGWVITEDDFISVYCVSLPWIGTSILMAPKSTLSDGLLYLVIIRKGVTRVQLTNILFAFETEKHLSLPGVETLPVTAFKLEPLTPNGHLTLDGELIEYGPIEAEVLQGCTRIMSK